MASPQMRTRLTTDGGMSTNWKFGYDLGADHYDFPIFEDTPRWPTSYSKFVDVVSTRKGEFNPCNHLSIESNAKRLVEPFCHTNGALISRLESMPVAIGVDEFWFGMAAIIPHPSPTLLSDWSLEAHSAFNDQVPATVSVANFVYELKDLKGMIPKIESSLTRTASSNFLAYNFGVAPFVGDVKKILDLADVVNKRLKYLKDTMGKAQKLRFKRKIPEESWNGASIKRLDPSSVVSTTYKSLGLQFEFRRVNYQGTFSAQADLFQNLEGLDTQLGSLKAFAAASGFNKPASIVWEAIPYSFVVDWFFHFSKSLDYLTIQPFGGEWSLSNVGYSLNEKWQYEIWQIVPLSPCATGGSNVGSYFLGSATIQRFIREPGLPMSSFYLTDGSLSPKQLALGLALLEQRR